jgi:hypothetical protein
MPADSKAIALMPRPLIGRGLVAAPRNAIRASNLKWELPIAATTGLVIATSDNHINNHIQSPTFVRDSGRGSNVGLGIELGAAGIDSSWNWY